MQLSQSHFLMRTLIFQAKHKNKLNFYIPSTVTQYSVREMNIVETWLANVAYSHSQSNNTEISYRQGLRKFLVFINKTPKQILKDYESTTDREFKRRYAKLVRAFISVQMKRYAVGSVGTFVSSINSFFKYNDLPLGHIPVSKGRVTYHNRDIEKHEIANILEINHTKRDRAFFCMMAQTGLRPYTLCKLKLKHVEPELSKKTIPCKIDVPKEIAKGEYHGYFTFMGEDSVKCLKHYLRERGRGSVEPDDYLFTKHGSNDPLTPNAMSVCFKALLNKLKKRGEISFERKDRKPAELRLYSLRKWFRKQAGHAGFDYVNFWMGHTLGVDDHYFSRDVELHRKTYREKAMPHLRLGKTTRIETEKEVRTLAAEVKKLKSELKTTKRAMKQFAEETRDKMIELMSELHTYREWDIQEQDREMQKEYSKDPKAFMKKYKLTKTEKEKLLKQIRQYWRHQPK